MKRRRLLLALSILFVSACIYLITVARSYQPEIFVDVSIPIATNHPLLTTALSHGVTNYIRRIPYKEINNPPISALDIKRATTIILKQQRRIEGAWEMHVLDENHMMAIIPHKRRHLALTLIREKGEWSIVEEREPFEPPFEPNKVGFFERVIRFVKELF